MTILTQAAGKVPALSGIPIERLAQHCQDPATLAAVISLAYNQGYQLGREQAQRDYSTMFAGQRQNNS
jgi:hypothetical protein